MNAYASDTLLLLTILPIYGRFKPIGGEEKSERKLVKNFRDRILRVFKPGTRKATSDAPKEVVEAQVVDGSEDTSPIVSSEPNLIIVSPLMYVLQYLPSTICI